MRIVFMGSAALACPSLERLLTSALNVVGVVTQPDRPKGRDLRPAACPVRAHIGQREIPILTPINVNSPESIAQLRSWRPDLIVVVAYGQILKPALLAIPARGCLNVHASLLPRYRGAAPIQWAIARGETQTGVTTMFMDAGLDTGDIIAQRMEPISAEDTAATLHTRLACLGAELLMSTLEAVRRGQVPRRPQDPAAASYAPKLRKVDGRLDWQLAAVDLANRVRGFNPWPGCYFERGGSAIKVLRARVEPGEGRPGEVLAARGAGPLIQTGTQALRLLELQPAGRAAMSGAAFLCGHRFSEGEQL